MRRLLVRPIPPFPSLCYGNFFFLFRLPPSAAEKGKGGGGGWKRMTTHKRTQEIFMEDPGGRRGSVSSFLPTVFSHRKGEEGKTSIFPLFGGASPLRSPIRLHNFGVSSVCFSPSPPLSSAANGGAVFGGSFAAFSPFLPCLCLFKMGPRSELRWENGVCARAASSNLAKLLLRPPPVEGEGRASSALRCRLSFPPTAQNIYTARG